MFLLYLLNLTRYSNSFNVKKSLFKNCHIYLGSTIKTKHAPAAVFIMCWVLIYVIDMYINIMFISHSSFIISF